MDIERQWGSYRNSHLLHYINICTCIFNLYYNIYIIVDCIFQAKYGILVLCWWHHWDQAKDCIIGLVWFMILNFTFTNISVISWRSVLLVEETGVPGEDLQPVRSHWQTWSLNVVSSTRCHERGSNSQL